MLIFQKGPSLENCSFGLSGAFLVIFKGVSVWLLHRLLSRGKAFRVALGNLAIKVNVHLLSVY